MRAAWKIMPPVLLCLPTMSEADGGGMTVEVPSNIPSQQYSITCCCCATDGSSGAVWHNGVRHGSVYEAKVVGSVFQQWLLRHERQATFWTAMHSCRPKNEEHFDHLICANQQITTRILYMEQDIGFNALETMVATLEYHKVCIGWVSQMIVQEQKEHHM